MGFYMQEFKKAKFATSGHEGTLVFSRFVKGLKCLFSAASLHFTVDLKHVPEFSIHMLNEEMEPGKCPPLLFLSGGTGN